MWPTFGSGTQRHLSKMRFRPSHFGSLEFAIASVLDCKTWVVAQLRFALSLN
jgi:hypothetical protein